MKSYEKYKRLIKLLFAAVLLLMLVGIYGGAWIGYYNKMILQAPFFRRGNWAVIALYGVLLAFFINAYGGFKVGYLKKGNLIYSQMLAVFFVNVVTYFQISILDKRFLSVPPMFAITVAEYVVILVWTLIFQTVYRRIFPPKKLLMIAGNRADYHLLDKMNARDDKYEIVEIHSFHEGLERLSEEFPRFDAVIIGDMPSHERNLILKYCFQESIRTYTVPKISDILLRSSVELNLFDSPLMLSRNIGLTVEQQWTKRLEDIVIALLMLVLFSPVFLIAAIGIKCTDRGPIFYKQERLTKDRKTFMIYKFRTMVVDAEKMSGPVLATEKDPRIIPIGRLLRATRLDELPQVLNILKGDMSVVGPRPERPQLAEQIERNIPEFSYRLKVKAGLTGYAQVYGKYNTTSYDKLKLDLMYIRKYSVLLDLKLIMMTPKIMLLKESTEGVMEDPDVPKEG